MSRNHLRDMRRELASSELQTELGHQAPMPRRRYYDVSMFRDDNADFQGIEEPSDSYTNSQFFSRQRQDGGLDTSNISHETQIQHQNSGVYQSPFFPSSNTHYHRPPGNNIIHQAHAQISPRPPSRLTLNPNLGSGMNVIPGSPKNIMSTPVDSSVFIQPSDPSRTRTSQSFYDRFKYNNVTPEPKTPTRPSYKPTLSSPSNGFGFSSSPRTVPSPSLRRHKEKFARPGVMVPPLAQKTHENPLRALISHRQTQDDTEYVDEVSLPSTSQAGFQHDSPNQRISLSHAPLKVQGIQLVPITSLPAKYHKVFPYKAFNPVQSKCFHAVFNTNDNFVLSSPTGSGKTVVMELAICRLIQTFEQGTFKIIYQAPTKALCAEKKRDWDKKFSPLGLKCTELTGDTSFNQLADVKSGDLIVTTPEKWDSVTRRWSDHRKLLGLVRLFLIDEVHMLKEDRGPTLEVVVSRMKTIGSRVRFVAISATVPNSKDIAKWLGKDSENPDIQAHEERLGEEFRPVKLEKIVYGYQSTANDFVFEKHLDQKLYEVIQQHSQRKPVLIFCTTRNACVSTAKLLAEKWNGSAMRERPWPTPLTSFSLRDNDLRVTGKAGVVFHHAGLDSSDRALIEKLFLEGHISVICCTSTLAVGVNLPAHLVVIKNTVFWQGGRMAEYMDLEVMQMVGRAGRPQFDQTGVAVIMTKKEKKSRYEKMISGSEKLESCLHLNLLEHLNAEIGLGTITDIESAKQWLKSTFLYVRMKANPAFYNLKVENIEAELESIVEKDIAALQDFGFVEYDQMKLKCLEPGDAMARYYVKFGTMKNIMELKEKPKSSEILMCISEADELKEFRIQAGEKAVLKEINSSPSMKWPVKVDISSAAHKANILIQFEIGRMDYPTTEALQKYRAQIFQEKSLIFQSLNRLIRCITDIKIFLRDAVGSKNSLELARCIEAKVWENSPSMLLQLDGLGPSTVRKFVSHDVKTLDQIAELESHKIETIVSRNPPYGAKLKQEIARIPKFRLFAQITRVQSNRRDPVKVGFRVEVGILNDETPVRWHGKLLHLYFLAERSDGHLIDFRRMPILKLSSNKDVVIQTEVTDPAQKITCHISCEEIVNTTKSVELDLKLDKSQFPSVSREQVSHPALVRKRPNSGQIGNNLETTAKIPNKPFKPPSRETSKVSEPASDDFGGSEFERDLKELDDVGEGITIIPPKVTEEPSWTAINKASNFDANFSINHASDDIQASQDNAEGQDDSQSKQRPDGRWECSHSCKDKSMCRHLCCREGLENKRKPKKRPTTKSSSKGLDPAQSTLWANCLDEKTSIKNSQKVTKPLPQTKPGYCPPRKRVSDLVLAASSQPVQVVDLSQDDEQPVFKGNGAKSVRKLNELHAKSQTNKAIKLPKNKTPSFPYESKSLPVVKRTSISTSDLEELLDDEDDFPTLSELLGQSKPAKNEDERKDVDDDYGIDDLLDDLDMEVFDKQEMSKKEVDSLDRPLMKPAMKVFDRIPRTQDMEDEGKVSDTARQLSISSDTLPSSPPLKPGKRLGNPIQDLTIKKTRLDIESETPPSAGHRRDKPCENKIFITTLSEGNDSNWQKGNDTGHQIFAQSRNMSTAKEGRNNLKTIEKEILDFLGDCVVFTD